MSRQEWWQRREDTANRDDAWASLVEALTTRRTTEEIDMAKKSSGGTKSYPKGKGGKYGTC